MSNISNIALTISAIEAARAALEGTELAAALAAEAKAMVKHSEKIVSGTMIRATELDGAGKWKAKMVCVIKTRGVDGEFDGNHRLVATSDLHQVHHTEEVKKELKKASRPSKSRKTEDAMAAKLRELGMSDEDIAALGKTEEKTEDAEFTLS